MVSGGLLAVLPRSHIAESRFTRELHPFHQRRDAARVRDDLTSRAFHTRTRFTAVVLADIAKVTGSGSWTPQVIAIDGPFHPVAGRTQYPPLAILTLDLHLRVDGLPVQQTVTLSVQDVHSPSVLSEFLTSPFTTVSGMCFTTPVPRS